MMHRVSVAILAGGKGNRFRQPKAQATVAGKPLVLHTVEACQAYAAEILLVVHTEEARTELSTFYPKEKILVDILPELQCPLVGALTAFRNAQNSYTQLIPCDSPLIDPMFFRIMWSAMEDHNAVVPRWPNGWVEPLHSIFFTSLAAQIAEQCLTENQTRMQCLIDSIGRVLYISTNALQRFDTKLETFININTPNDLRRVERLLRHRAAQHR